MANNLEVSIVANIQDFQEKLREAQQNLKAATDDMKNWSAEVNASGGANTYAVGRMKEASTAVAEYTVDIANAKQGLAAAIPTMQEFSGSTAVATRELLVLAREGARGNFTRMAGSLSILAQSGLGVGPGMIAAAAAVGGLVFGLEKLITSSDNAAQALQGIRIGAQFLGGVTLSTQQIKNLEAEFDKVPGTISVDSQKIVAAFSTMRTSSVPEIEALGQVVKDYASASRLSGDQAVEALKKAFNEPLKSAVEFVTQLRGVTAAQVEQARAAVNSGNANQAAAAMLNALADSLQLNNPLTDENTRLLDVQRGISQRATIAGQVMTGNINEQNAAREKQIALLRELAGAMGATPTDPNEAMVSGLADASKIAPALSRIDELKAKIQEFTALLPAAQHEMQATGDSKPFLQLTAAIKAANEEIKQLGRDKSAEEAAKKALQAQTQLGRDLIADTKDQIAQQAAAEGLGHTEELVAAKAAWEALLAQHKLTAAQRKQVEIELANTIVQIQRQQEADAKAIAQDQTKTDIDIAKLQLQARKDGLDAEVAAHQITAAQKLAIERQLTTDLANEDIKRLQTEQAGLDQQSVEYQKLADQIRLIRAHLNVDLAALGKQEVAQSNKDDLEQALAWRDAVQEMGRVSDSFVRDVFSGQKTLIQSLQSLTSQWLQSEIAADIKWLAMKELYSALGLQDEMKNLKGGLLVTLLTDQQKVVSAETSAAQIQAAQATTSSGGILSMIGDAIKAITTDAAKVFAGVFGFLAPELGPAAAGPAAASQAAVLAATGPLMAFDVGAWEIPHDMAAIVHQGEMIVPATYAAGLRSGGGPDTGGAGANITINYTANGLITPAEIRRNAQLIASTVASHMNLNPSSRPGY